MLSILNMTSDESRDRTLPGEDDEEEDINVLDDVGLSKAEMRKVSINYFQPSVVCI